MYLPNCDLSGYFRYFNSLFLGLLGMLIQLYTSILNGETTSCDVRRFLLWLWKKIFTLFYVYSS